MKRILNEEDLKSCIGGYSAVEFEVIQSALVALLGPTGQLIVNFQDKTLALVTDPTKSQKLLDFYGDLNAAIIQAIIA